MAEPQPKKTLNRKERKGRKEEGTHHESTKVTKNDLKKVNHKGPSAAKPQRKKTISRKERKGRREEGTHHEGTKHTKGSDNW